MNSTRRKLLYAFGLLPLLANRRSSYSSIRKPVTSNLEALRRQFPQLAISHDTHPLVYLDSAATTLRPRSVTDAIVGFYQSRNANPGRDLHFLATHAAEEFDTARAEIAKFVNASSPLEMIWTRGTTEGINLVASAWGSSHLQHGDELILTIAEHASSMLPWQLAAERAGATIRYADVDDEGRLCLEAFDNLLSKRTKLVCFTHVSNVLGAINPAREICRRAKQAGARVMIDAAQSVPHIPIDVQDLGCDFVAFSGHKMLGPMGIGVLYARQDAMEEMRVYQSGSNMAHARKLTEWDYSPAALRFGAGTPNVADAIGLAAAAELLTSWSRSQLWAREQQLTQYALERLRSVPGLRILGPSTSEGRVSTFSFVIESVPTPVLVQKLDRRGICIRAGDLACMPLLRRFGIQSAARASMYLYTTEEEVDRLADGLAWLGRIDEIMAEFTNPMGRRRAGSDG